MLDADRADAARVDRAAGEALERRWRELIDGIGCFTEEEKAIWHEAEIVAVGRSHEYGARVVMLWDSGAEGLRSPTGRAAVTAAIRQAMGWAFPLVAFEWEDLSAAQRALRMGVVRLAIERFDCPRCGVAAGLLCRPVKDRGRSPMPRELRRPHIERVARVEIP